MHMILLALLICGGALWTVIRGVSNFSGVVIGGGLESIFQSKKIIDSRGDFDKRHKQLLANRDALKEEVAELEAQVKHLSAGNAHLLLAGTSVSTEPATCRHCGSPMAPSDKFCPECGKAATTQKTNIAKAKASKVNRCKSCGFILAKSATHCSKCGKPQETNVEAKEVCTA